MKKSKWLQAFQALHKILKKTKRLLLMHDWVWSVLLTFFAYLFVNYGPPQIFNVPMAYFTINWIQPLIATAGVMSGLYSIARLGLYFNIRKMHEYMYGKRNTKLSLKELDEQIQELEKLKCYETPSTPRYDELRSEIGRLRNQSTGLITKGVDERPAYFNPSYSDFKKLSPWQRLSFLSLFLLFFFATALIVFLKFIPLNAPA